MKILLIAATGAEIALSIKHIASVAKEVKPGIFTQNGHEIQFAVTGVGAAATIYNLTKILSADKFDLVIQAGIGGSFDRSIGLGDVVFIQSDRFADAGAENGDDFIDIFDLGLIAANEHPYYNKVLVNPSTPNQLNLDIPAVTALTVNTVTGNDATALKLTQQCSCRVESMEGAALHYVCLNENVPFMQLRAISNYVEKRNRASWQMEQALTNLSNTLQSYIAFLFKQ